MPTLQFRQTKKIPSAEKQFKVIRAELQKSLKPVGEQHVKQRADVVEDFTNKPKFDFTIVAGQKIVGLRIVLINGNQKLKNGSATIRDLVKWLFVTGTRAHKIKSKKPGGILAFPWGGPGSYSRKTSTPGRSRGSGLVSGAVPTFRQQVDHPGTKRSDEFDKINERLKQFNLKQMDKGIKRGLKKLSKRR